MSEIGEIEDIKIKKPEIEEAVEKLYTVGQHLSIPLSDEENSHRKTAGHISLQ